MNPSVRTTLSFALLCGLVLCLSPACSGEKSPKASAEKAELAPSMILSAEQAVARFNEACKTELEPLAEKEKKAVAARRAGDNLSVRQLLPRDYQPPYRPEGVQEDPRFRILGSFAAVRECKNDTWLLFYDTGLAGGINAILDGVTGKILYMHFVPEG